MSVRPLRNHPRIVVAVGFLATVAAIAAWQHGGAIGQEPRKEVNPEALRYANMLSEAFNNAAEIAMPSVVTIHSRTKAKPVSAPRNAPTPAPGENPFKGTPFEDFFQGHEFKQFGQQGPQFRPRQGVGTGVIIDRSGIVLTNNHVVEGADEVVVHLADGREFKAEDIATDEKTDLAVLRIKGAGTLPAATLGDSDKLRIGDWVIAIGNPFELEQTVSTGVISGMGRQLNGGRATRTRYLQTDAAINPGNSGGPLVDLHGHVIGINTAIATNTGTFSGIGFAIPVNKAKWVTRQLIEEGRVARAYLGVNISPISPEMAQAFGAQPGTGTLVQDVFPNTPAAAAGIEAGDIILKFADTRVKDAAELQQVVERSPVDSKQQVEILRDGKTMTVSVVPKEMPSDIALASAERGPSTEQPSKEPGVYNAEELGLQVSDLPAEQARQLNLSTSSGVLIIGVDPNSRAFEEGLREGMVVLKVGKTPVKSTEEFKTALEGHSLTEGVLLYVHSRAGTNSFVLLKE